MKLTLAEPRYLTDSISIISELVNEVKLSINKDKIEIIAMDPANVAMVVFNLLSSAFAEYEVKEPKEIFINLDSLKQALKRAKPSDTLSLDLDEEKNKLIIKVKGDSAKVFNLSLLNNDEREQKVPDLKFPVKIETNALIFNEAVEDMNLVAESVALIAEKEKLTINSESKLSAARVEIKGPETKVSCNGITKAKYSLEYLKKIIKGAKLTDNVLLQFDEDYPLRVDYAVPDKLSLSVILAPRVSNE